MNVPLANWTPPSVPAPPRTGRDPIAVAALAVALVPWIWAGYLLLARWTTLPSPGPTSGRLALAASPAGALLGVAAQISIRRSGGRRRGEGYAIAAMLLPLAFLVVLVAFFVLTAGNLFHDSAGLATRWTGGVANVRLR